MRDTRHPVSVGVAHTRGETVDDTNDGPDGWVDKLIESARESTRATADGMTEMAGDVAEVGGAVAKLAEAVTRMAVTCERTKKHADDARHGLVATDWFWRQVRTALAGHKKAVAGGLACLCFGFGGPTVPATGAATSTASTPIGVADDVEQLIATGRTTEAEAVIARRWKAMGDADGYWMLARVRKVHGDEPGAAVLFRSAADAGHTDAAKVIDTHTGW